jgi:flagellar hook-associated protein 2
VSSLGLSGLASGVDTSGIVDKLMSIDRQAVTKIKTRQTSVTAHQTALKAVSDKLNTLRTAAMALASADSWKTNQAVSSSDPAKVAATITSGAGIGGHTIVVDRLASSAQHGFTYLASSSPSTLTVGTATISLAANASAKDVAAAINASQSSPAVAAVVKGADGVDRLVLSSKTSGQASDFTASGPQLTEDPAYPRTGAILDAAFHIDGEPTARTSASNAIDDAIPGVRLTLKGVTADPVTITADAATIDKAAIKSKVQAFVDAYNSVVDLTRGHLNDKTDPLFGDLQLGGVLSNVRNMLQTPVAGLGTLGSLADVGVTVPKSSGGAPSDDAKAGKLTFDGAKLDQALDGDWTQVRQLFNGVGAKKGYSWLLNDTVNAQTGLNGVLTGRMKSDDTQLTGFTKQITDTNRRLDATEARLKAQFAAMESALQSSQTQQAWLTGQINSLSGNTR